MNHEAALYSARVHGQRGQCSQCDLGDQDVIRFRAVDDSDAFVCFVCLKATVSLVKNYETEKRRQAGSSGGGKSSGGVG